MTLEEKAYKYLESSKINDPQHDLEAVSEIMAEFARIQTKAKLEEEEKKPELFKYPDADCCEGILELYEGAYKCNSCGAFYGVDWEDGKTYLENLEPLTPPTEKNKIMSKQLEKSAEYAVKIYAHLLKMFDESEESENFIDLKQVKKDDSATELIHAISNIVPQMFYEKFSGEDADMLAFNHICNRLIFQFSNLIDK